MESKSKMGLVYCITCNETNENFIGTTITTLKQRMANHKSKYSCARSIIDRNNYKVIILEDNIDKDILRIREQFYMDCCDNLVNKMKAYTKPKEKERCECGCMVANINKHQHILTWKHIKIMKKIYSLKCINRYFNPYGYKPDL